MLESFLEEILQGFFLESGKVLVGCAWFFGELQRDSRLFHFYFQTLVKFQEYSIAFYAEYFAVDATYGDHFISFFDFFDKLLGVFLFFLLRPDHEEVHDQDDGAKQKYLTKNATAPYGSLR